MKDKWVKCDGYWKEIHQTLLDMGYDNNSVAHEKCWGYWIGPHGISQISEGCPVSLEKSRAEFNPDTREFSLFKPKKIEIDYLIFFYGDMVQIKGNKGVWCFDITKPYHFDVHSNILSISQDDNKWDLFFSSNDNANDFLDKLCGEIYNSRTNELMFNK